MPRISITIPGDEPQPYSVPADTKLLTIGRSAANDLVIDHNSISSQHCELKRVNGGFIIADAGSTNGIRLEQVPMDVIDLQDGTQLEIGDALFLYELAEEEKEAFASEPFKSRQRKKKPQKPQPSAAPPAAQTYRRPAMASAKKSNGGLDFAIFLIFAAVALVAFYFGLSKAHIEATRTESNPTGRSLMADMKAAKEAPPEEPEAE